MQKGGSPAEITMNLMEKFFLRISFHKWEQLYKKRQRPQPLRQRTEMATHKKATPPLFHHWNPEIPFWMIETCIFFCCLIISILATQLGMWYISSLTRNWTCVSCIRKKLGVLTAGLRGKLRCIIFFFFTLTAFDLRFHYLVTISAYILP